MQCSCCLQGGFGDDNQHKPKGRSSVKKPLAVKKLPSCLGRERVDLTACGNAGGDRLKGRKKGVGRKEN